MRTFGSQTSLRLGGACAVLLALGLAGRAEASEGGASFYLLGSGGPEAAVTPPVQGIFVDDTFYVYDGSAKGSQKFNLGEMR